MPVGLTGEEETRLEGVAFHPEGWPLAQAGRVVMLLAAMDQLPDDEHGALVAEVYRVGDIDERVAILRGLPYFPSPERFLAVAAEGVRANPSALVEAVACDNPYPCAYFDEAAWNQMVMKAVFCGFPLERVVGLRTRNNEALGAMAADYASERRSAGRSVPSDLDLLSGEAA